MTNSLICPMPECGTDNTAEADDCSECGAPLKNYARLASYPAQLFNRGLAAARAGELATARDLFAAVVLWCPLDRDARNALALASFEAGDRAEARRQWERVLRQYPDDPLARCGLTDIDDAPSAMPS